MEHDHGLNSMKTFKMSNKINTILKLNIQYYKIAFVRITKINEYNWPQSSFYHWIDLVLCTMCVNWDIAIASPTSILLLLPSVPAPDLCLCDTHRAGVSVEPDFTSHTPL